MLDTPLYDEEIIFHVLNGFGSDYKEISTIILAHDNPVSFKELHDKLFNYEAYLKRESPPFDTTFIITNFVNKANFK